MVFKKIPINEALGSPKETKENSNPMAKEGTNTVAAKESLRSQHTLKMTVSVEATKLNSHN